MKTSDGSSSSTSEDVERLLQCFHRGLSPLSRARTDQSCHVSKTPVAKTFIGVHTKADENAFVTPESKYKSPTTLAQEVTPGVFYGSPIGKLSKRPPQILRLLHEIRRDLAAEGYATSRDTIWATFPKQDQAVQFAESHGNREIAVFVYQDHLSGQRRFLATSYKEFWHRYECIPIEYRHHYEIITEGSPCHLYFDLEFDCEANVGLNGEAMVDTLLLKVAEALHKFYSLQYDCSWTIELDSSTNEKFSRHVIVRIPKVAFQDNSHVGAFVAEVCKMLDKLQDKDEKVSQLYVLKGHSRENCHSHLFLDQAVYSRNRSFRLPFSSKAGKTSRLLPSGRFCCNGMSEYEIFMDSLICRVSQDCERLLTFGSEAAGSGEFLPIWRISSRSLTKSVEFCTAGKSPFPELDTFIESIACIGGSAGKIRSWYWFSEYGVVVYNITGNRYCENIGRQHKSNHVMYIVDFRTAGYYQKCHDPDCRGYKSPLRPIPHHTIPLDFPQSTALESCYEACSAESFSRLFLENKADTSDDASGLTGSHKGSYDEETWWEEVVNTIESMEESSASQTINSQDDFLKDLVMDDDWWSLVEQEARKVEKLLTSV